MGGNTDKFLAPALVVALLGFSILSIGDAIVKSMAGEWPGTAIASLRYVLGTLFLGAFIALRIGRAGFAVRRLDLQFARGAAVSIASVSFFFAVQLMPLAEATSIQFTSPILVALFTPFLLRESTNRAALLCSVLALAGVVMVLRPNLLTLGAAALLPVLTAMGMALLMIFNRKSLGTGGVLALQFWIALLATPILLVVTFIGDVLGPPQLNVPWPQPLVVLKCAGVAVTGTLAHWLIYVATQRASAAVVAPMAYVQLLVAAAIGWFLFGHGVDLISAAGMALIVGAGLLLWWSQPSMPVPNAAPNPPVATVAKDCEP